ncbi:DNA repair protein RecO [Lactococcus hodotermopsidis]|uniref:DNA repair protein RecO n=1 Tax=Pseudolactococcus hodotermopsidis TaxID=2709157 RepID=A0A6A0BAU1_9LACT|nr:DNA repair protein RecO [Lactococcus hodotermopsidis]GFH41578.1 DNA repair protein RecO [Lactococcus hodotermopsidis]
MQNVETGGLVLFSRNYREQDKLVKIFTESFGKRMFFVKNANKSKFSSSLQNFTQLELVAAINDEGLSFISDISDATSYQFINSDIFAQSYASYIISLADVAIPDNHYDAALYGFLMKSLELIDNKIDMEIVTNIFELQIMSRFGAQLDFDQCVCCHRQDLPMDFSKKYNGCLCRNHFDEDMKREHIDPNVIFLCHSFMAMNLETLPTINISDELKAKIRCFIDLLYDHYIGVHLKAKKFIDGLSDWADIMK